MIGREKGRYAVYLLLKLVLSIAAGILFTIIAIVPVLFVVVPGVIAVIAGRAVGMGWNVTTISLAIICGSVLFVVLIYLVALVCVPATVFSPGVCDVFSSRPLWDSRRAAAPRTGSRVPCSGTTASPGISPPFEPPPLPPSAEPIG